MAKPRARPKKAVKSEIIKKKCTSCEKTMTITNFYSSRNPFHSDGHVGICKKCIVEHVYDKETDTLDVNKLKEILRQIDRPFISTAWESAKSEIENSFQSNRIIDDNKNRVVTRYFKNIASLPQYSKMNWDDGIAYESSLRSGVSDGVKYKIEPKRIDNYDPEAEIVYSVVDDEDDEDFTVTKEIVRLFGNGYTKKEYKAMMDKYTFLSESYPIQTNMHVEALVTYSKYKVKEEFAIASGDIIGAEKWGALASKAADKAKLNPNQFSAKDLQGGVSSYSEFFMGLEQCEDIIPILPEFKFRPNDALDFTIWCYVNYLRNLDGKPICEYEDVYRFYDERKREYIEQYGDPYGIFEGDTTDNNRDKIKKFIKLPKIQEQGD